MTIRDASLSSDPHPTFPTTDPPMVTIGPWTPNADAIADLARSALGEPTAAVSAWRVEPVGYDFGSPTTEGLFRIRGDARVGGVAPRQRRLFGRPVGEEGRMIAAEPGLDALQQQAEEQIFPGFAGAERRAAGAARGTRGRLCRTGLSAHA